MNQILEVNKGRFVIAIESVALRVTELVSLPGKGQRAECLFFFFKGIYYADSIYSVYKNKL